MLGCGVFVLMPKSLAQGLFANGPFRRQKEDVIEALLNLPAPPPPNPLDSRNARDENFYDPKKPPPDDAPIDDLIDYWSHQSQGYRGTLNYLVKPSDKVSERLLDAIQSDPSKFSSLSNVIPDNDRSASVVKGIYDGLGRSKDSKDLSEGLRDWLKMNSSFFADDLERTASATRDSGGYVSLENENNVLALTKHDWERAKPVVDRMYNDTSNPVTRVLGTWALYKHALLNNDAGDVDRYRAELMRTVEDKTLSDGVRDKANDAIAHETDFVGRDDWTFSLFEDESLVKMDRFTMLTTLVMYDPPDKHVAKLVGLLDSKNKLTRYGAVRCLMIVADRVKDPAIVRGMLPWIQDSNWVDIEPDNNSRVSIVNQLANLKMPEAVPALIAALDEKATRTVAEDVSGYSNANMAYATMPSNAARRVWTSNSAVNTAANFSPNVKTRTETYFPLQEAAIRALAFQADPRAVPALRRLLAQTKEDYRVEELMRAIFACGGYSVGEQVEALEYFAGSSAEAANILDRVREQFPGNVAIPPQVLNQYMATYAAEYAQRLSGNRRDPKFQLGMMVAGNDEPSLALATAVVDRIEELEKKDAVSAQTLRQIIVRWKGLAISTMLLRDLKNGKAESATIVRLLTERKTLRENLAGEVAAARGGPPIALSTGACILDDAGAYGDILEGKEAEARTALYACARLIRATLPLERAAVDMKSENALLKSAAELYLESEDSPEARSIVLSQHPGEAKILGARMYFEGLKDSSFVPQLEGLFSSANRYAGPAYAYRPEYDQGEIKKLEEKLQKEVKQDAELNGVYAYQDNFIRLYKSRIVFSWEDDPLRYHERDLSKEEFDLFKNYLASHNVGEMKPFVTCSGGCGVSRELLMLGRNGGSRVFLQNQQTPPFFAGLEKIFAEFRSQPSAVKYALSKEIPGLELLYASDDLGAETVWKQGNDLRVVVGDTKIREGIDTEITRLEESEQRDNSDEEDDTGDEPEAGQVPQPVMPSQRMRLRRQYDEYEWRILQNGQLGEQVTQPNGVEYIPLKDAFDTQPIQEQWKARGAGIEVRVGFDGLYKVAAGRLTKLLPGDFSSPVISPNGHWIVAHRFSDEEGDVSVIRYNLLTKRSYKVELESYGELRPSCYIASLGKFLLVVRPYSDEEYSDRGDEDDEESGDSDGESAKRYYLLDAETGAISPTTAEVRPLVQQTFRPLQSTDRPNEFWAALSFGEKHETVVGKYDSRTLKFTPVRKLPKINFNSMRMWVDEAEGKIYFVYNGHVLGLPLR